MHTSYVQLDDLDLLLPLTNRNTGIRWRDTVRIDVRGRGIKVLVVLGERVLVVHWMAVGGGRSFVERSRRHLEANRWRSLFRC